MPRTYWNYWNYWDLLGTHYGFWFHSGPPMA